MARKHFSSYFYNAIDNIMQCLSSQLVRTVKALKKNFDQRGKLR